MYATDRRQTKVSLNASALRGRRHNIGYFNILPGAVRRFGNDSDVVSQKSQQCTSLNAYGVSFLSYFSAGALSADSRVRMYTFHCELCC